MSSAAQITILIPTPLRRYTGGESRVQVDGGNVASALDDLEVQFPGIGERIRDDSGQIRRFVNLFVNGQNVRDADGIDTVLSPGDELGIIPAMAGGCQVG